MMSEIKMPEEAAQFCKEVIELARKHKIQSVNGTFQFDTFNTDIDWRNNISFKWSSGRHGCATEFTLSSQFSEWVHEERKY